MPAPEHGSGDAQPGENRIGYDTVTIPESGGGKLSP
jgi:hypothetical protein